MIKFRRSNRQKTMFLGSAASGERHAWPNRGKLRRTDRRVFQTPGCEAAGTVVEMCAMVDGIMVAWRPNCATANVVQTIKIV